MATEPERPGGPWWLVPVLVILAFLGVIFLIRVIVGFIAGLFFFVGVVAVIVGGIYWLTTKN